MTKPTSILILIALALCGCQDQTGSAKVEKVMPDGYRVEVVEGVRCIRYDFYARSGLSCDWVGYHQREPERQPPDVEAVKRCINSLDPDSVELAAEILECAK